MKVSDAPADPSLHNRLRKMPQPVGTVPAGHVAVTVVRHADPFGLQDAELVTVNTVLPGPAGPVSPVGP